MQNLAVEIKELPSIKMLHKQSLADHYAAINLFANFIFYACLALIAFIVSEFEFLKPSEDFKQFVAYLPLILVLLGCTYCCYQWFADKAKAYSLRQHDISFFSGLLFKRLTTQPISRIQHVEVSQGPIDRVAKLGKLQVYSAGSSMQTFAIPGLPIDIAHQLRQQLTQMLAAREESAEQDA